METGTGIVIGVGPSGLVNIVRRFSYRKDWKYTYGALSKGQNGPRAAGVHARTLDDAFESSIDYRLCRVFTQCMGFVERPFFTKRINVYVRR